VKSRGGEASSLLSVSLLLIMEVSFFPIKIPGKFRSQLGHQ